MLTNIVNIKNNFSYFIEKNTFFKVFIYFLSWAIVSFGQPARSPLLCVLSGCCGYALFWLSQISNDHLKKRFYFSFFWFSAVQCIQLSWMTSVEYQGQYIYLIYLALSLILGAQWGLLTLIVPTKKNQDFTLKLLFIASCWVFIEWSRLFWFSGFPFNPVGLSLAGNVIGKQFASIGGVYALSFWVIYSNLCVYFLFLQKIKRKDLVKASFVVALPYLFGMVFFSYHLPKINKAELFNAVLVQTALTPLEKSGLSHPSKMIHPLEQWRSIFTYLEPYQKQPIDLIALPENTVPFEATTQLYPAHLVQSIIQEVFGGEALKHFPMFHEDCLLNNRIMSQFLSDYFHAQVIVGLEETKYYKDEIEKAYAGAFCFTPNQSIQIYHKQILLPIVEYMPFQWCVKIAKKYGISGWFERGSVAEVFEGPVKVLPSICIEELYGSLIRKSRLLGSDVLVNITNDVWFPNSKLPIQHYTHGNLRCNEMGLPLLRSCNVGVTSALDALGRPIAFFSSHSKQHQWKKGALKVSVPKYSYHTLYLYWGDFFILFSSFLIVVSFLMYHEAFGILYSKAKTVFHFQKVLKK